MALPWQTLATVRTVDGALELRQRGEADFLITIAGRVLMTSAARRSEEALATVALAARPSASAPRVLLGGLGMGYTLRAALDVLPAAARVDVAELTPSVVEWCKGPLAVLTNGAVSDKRVRVIVGDVARVIRDAAPASYDAILLDLYEGPYASTQERHDPFFGAPALARSAAALRVGGIFAVWAEDLDPSFTARLAAAGLTATIHRAGKGGRTHVVYIATRPVARRR